MICPSSCHTCGAVPPAFATVALMRSWMRRHGWVTVRNGHRLCGRCVGPSTQPVDDFADAEVTA